MHVGTEGTTPGVEQGKELSLLVKEQSSPESHSPWAGADGPQPVTYTIVNGGLMSSRWLSSRHLILIFSFFRELTAHRYPSKLCAILACLYIVAMVQ